MSLKIGLTIATVLLTAISVIAQADTANQPDIEDATYEIGTHVLEENAPVKGIVPFNSAKAAYDNPNAHLSQWEDPFWDDEGWALMKDSAAFGSVLHGVPFASKAFTVAEWVFILAEFQKEGIENWENEHGVTDFWLSVLPHEPLDSPSETSSVYKADPEKARQEWQTASWIGSNGGADIALASDVDPGTSSSVEPELPCI